MAVIKAYQLKEGDVTKWGTVAGVDKDVLNVMVKFTNGQVMIFPNDKPVTKGDEMKYAYSVFLRAAAITLRKGIRHDIIR